MENKNVGLLGDFNIDLMKCSSRKDTSDTSDYFELLTSNYFLPHITFPTRITARPRTLIDNIFCNCSDVNIVSGNLTISISDHSSHFLFILISIRHLYLENITFLEETRKTIVKKIKIF